MVRSDAYKRTVWKNFSRKFLIDDWPSSLHIYNKNVRLYIFRVKVNATVIYIYRFKPVKHALARLRVFSISRKQNGNADLFIPFFRVESYTSSVCERPD